MGSGEELGTSDLFHLKARLQLPPREILQNVAKITVGGFNYFAASVKHSGSLLLVSDGYPRSSGSGAPDIGPADKKWSLRQIPWFDDETKKITALSFSGDGTLYIGTQDGYIYEINAVRVSEGLPGIENELKIVFHLHEFTVLQLVVWYRENMKMILCNGDNSRLAIVHANSLPVLVTFLSNISHLEIFTNSVGLSCLLVCLENSSNVYCVLDDLEVPIFEPEAPGKKSLFRKARDNFMSKFSDEKMNFFNRKGSKDTGHQGSVQRPNTVVSSTSIPSLTTFAGSGGIGSTLVSPKQYPISNIKFLPVEEVHCRGLLRKIFGKNQFSRHVNNKLDLFDGDFRQTAAVYIPNHINKLYVIQRIFFGVDEENKCIRISVVHSGTLKEFAAIPIASKILSIEPLDEDDPSVAPYSVFIISQNGIYEICLKKTPLDTCVDLLLKETNNVMLDVLCIALNVSKSDVCVLAGDTRAEEGKFAKAILYYKIAGLNYMKIMAKFGSRGHIPAMLCFYELMDQEQRNKLSGNNNDRQTMANLALAARIEQCLRHGKSIGDISRSPKNLLKNMLSQNLHYSAKHAAIMLCHVQLIWALKLVGNARLCYPNILKGLSDKSEDTDVFAKKRAFWEILTSDWLTIYTAAPSVFAWFRAVVMKKCQEITSKQLYDLIMVLIPWRRELQPKFFDARSPQATEIIDFTVTNDAGRVSMDDYISLFIRLILEAIRRKDLDKFSLPNFVFKGSKSSLDKVLHSNSPEQNATRKDNDSNQISSFNVSNLQAAKLFSASSHHCACIRNGKVFTWGENKVGRLGHADDYGKLNVESPSIVNICPSLRLSIESVSCGINHSVVLTSVGTIFIWGSNALGQLGLGKQAMWTSRPIPLTIQPDVIIIRVAAGGYHTVAVDHLNRVWTWGWGVHGQLGDGGFENSYKPQLIKVPEKIISVSAGHSHTALLSKTGRVYTFGCDHFGQIGQGVPQKKVKVPTLISGVHPGVIFRSVDCGLCSTAMVSTKNKLYYAGLNPGTLRTILSGQKRREQRNNAIAAGIPQSEIVFEEEKDFSAPVIIDTSHLAGEIIKVNVATTHMGVLTSLGMVYTWGLGKSGQLVRPDDDSRTLELIDTEDKIFIASDICCGGDCTFVIEKDSHRCFGCGFNSSGQLGKLQTDEESAVMTIKTKKRVVKVRQPSNIYFRLREIPGLPKLGWERESDGVKGHTLSPRTVAIDQDLLEWVLRAYKRNYDPKAITETCLHYGNYAAASLLETMAENHEFALKHSLSSNPGNKEISANLVGNYLHQTEKSNTASVNQACRFLRVVISHWADHSLVSSDLEEILDPFLSQPPWNVYLNCAVKDIISSADDSAKWIAANMTPRFILRAIRDSKNGTMYGTSASNNVVSSPTTSATAAITTTITTTPLSPLSAPNVFNNSSTGPANYNHSHSHNSGEESFKINGIRQQLSSSNSKHEDMGSGRDNNNLDFKQS